MCNNTNLIVQLADEPPAMSEQEGAFFQKMIDIADHASAALMISVGHRTGLWETIKRAPMTSVELAEAAKLNERYVREWLGAMAAAGILDLDRESRRYSLPPVHASFLGRDAEKGNMAGMTQFIAVMGSVESKIVDCFRNGGGVPYADFDRFHEVMAEESAQTSVGGLEEHILPLVPGLREKLEAGIGVVDIGCGRGAAMIRLAQLFPNSRFTGYDLCDDTIDFAKADAAAKGLTNVRFEARDVTTLDGEAYDLVFTFDAVHDQAHPAVVLENIRRILKPGGVYLMQDIDAATDVADNVGRPLATFTYTISCMHCMTVSLAQGGDGLGAAWGEELALAMLKDAGFGDVETHRLPHDIVNIYYVCR